MVRAARKLRTIPRFGRAACGAPATCPAKSRKCRLSVSPGEVSDGNLRLIGNAIAGRTKAQSPDEEGRTISGRPWPARERGEAKMDTRRLIAAVLVLTILAGAPNAVPFAVGQAAAQSPPGAPAAPPAPDGAAAPSDDATPPRLSFVDGEVSFWRPGSEDWAPARLNIPLAPGDVLYAGRGG